MPITIILSWIIGRRVRVYQNKSQIASSKQQSYLTEIIQNFLMIKSYQYKGAAIRRTESLLDDRLYYIKMKNRIRYLTNILLGLGYRLGTLSALLIGAYRLSLGSITFGTFTAFLQLVNQIQSPIEGLTRTLPQIITSTTSLNRIQGLRDLAEGSSDEDNYKSIHTYSPNYKHIIWYDYGQSVDW